MKKGRRQFFCSRFNPIPASFRTPPATSRYATGFQPEQHTRSNYSHYSYGLKDAGATLRSAAGSDRLASSENKDSAGNYISRKYKLNFSPDLIYGAANYNTFYGLQGTTVLAFSDMLGDYQIMLQASLMIDLKNSDYGISYYYLPNRTDYGFQAFHSARFLYDYDTLYRYAHTESVFQHLIRSIDITA